MPDSPARASLPEEERTPMSVSRAQQLINKVSEDAVLRQKLTKATEADKPRILAGASASRKALAPAGDSVDSGGRMPAASLASRPERASPRGEIAGDVHPPVYY